MHPGNRPECISTGKWSKFFFLLWRTLFCRFPVKRLSCSGCTWHPLIVADVMRDHISVKILPRLVSIANRQRKRGFCHHWGLMYIPCLSFCSPLLMWWTHQPQLLDSRLRGYFSCGKTFTHKHVFVNMFYCCKTHFMFEKQHICKTRVLYLQGFGMNFPPYLSCCVRCCAGLI